MASLTRDKMLIPFVAITCAMATAACGSSSKSSNPTERLEPVGGRDQVLVVHALPRGAELP